MASIKGVVYVIGFMVIALSLIEYFNSSNIKKCEFVCSHLVKEVKLGKQMYIEKKYRNLTSTEGEVEYPYPTKDGTPIECYCSFKIKELEENTSSYDIFDVREVVYKINYTDWLRWWLK
ncbi:MAG: hypothetical protein DRO93_08665 [Candidatus Thorarchaeota archaeon]|nr:MAG: hypothetical protein DRO93_08665 [Candidatus Thorarchaeota archaeon]